MIKRLRTLKQNRKERYELRCTGTSMQVGFSVYSKYMVYWPAFLFRLETIMNETRENKFHYLNTTEY